jgi:hypothetical protein
MKSNSLLFTFALCLTVQLSFAQSNKLRIYGDIGMGVGQAIINTQTKTAIRNALGGGFEPSIGNNLLMGFYISPENWKGLGIGSRIHGTFGTPTNGDNGDKYVFNYYNLAVASKYFLVTKTYNKGIYVNASLGFGQLTTKRLNETSNAYQHQYAIGTSLMGGVGYTFPFKKTALSVELQYENANRNGTVNGVKESVKFQTGQIGGNIILSF